MKQPKFNLLGNEYSVISIDFDKNTGEITKVTIKYNEYRNLSIFKGDCIPAENLVEDVKITEPTRHPYHNYYYAPDLGSLLI
ncbi:hypothetical protein COF42_30005 [Bacillus wiedmannii]|uniref:hypothetical protein n=1 Tax=Bacillus wiedmannii TaxID=1890302 RepID=UPI000BFE7ACF|nr:hypothetical protein [Bacillus wiedmannii]PHC80402.1 hypothetical protein COF42_30005 [Bacillus wiedmannii]